jgi:hypothetical protein
MSHRMQVAVLALIAWSLCVLVVAAPVAAQRSSDDGDTDRFSLALGAGVVEPDDEGEIYYAAAFRIGFRQDERERDDEDWRYARPGDIRAYIEPEIGYWERDDRAVTESDLLVGVNAIGVVPGRTVDYFFGVGLGLHSLDTQIRAAGRTTFDESDTKLGGNFQVGLDIHLTDSTSVFGAGRFDILEDVDDTLQGKVYMGLRFRF